MILCDTNVLLYAYDASSVSHGACREWLESALNSAESIGLPWQSLHAFLRIATHPRVYERPMRIDAACSVIATWLARPNVVVPEPGVRYWQLLREQLLEARVSGALVTDAALAALAIECGARLCTTDRDFRRFGNLKVLDPTA